MIINRDKLRYMEIPVSAPPWRGYAGQAVLKNMIIKNTRISSEAIKFVIEKDGKTAGRAYLYLIYNDLHKEPYGFLEDVFVEEEFRSKGVGGELVKAVIDEAKVRGCYKLVGTSRNSRSEVHEFYKKLGFEDYGKEFRMDLAKP